MELERVTGVDIADEMRISYMDYAMSVIIGRALPDARDGLKPVHRRILYAMFREGLLHNKRYSKCAGVVGEVLKKYHPHGDSAVYDAMVRLAQEWNLRYPLVDGQGNFGSVDGDPAAAYRYTESRLTALAEELLADIDKETVDFTPNFDEQTVEPVVLPTRVPNLIVNGSAGIAVGMATNIPPHNLTEISNALLHLIDHPDATVVDLMKHVPGPDFPTGAVIFGREGIRQAFETGRGIVRVRARARIERDEKRDRESIIVTEIPYQVNKAKLIEKIAELVQEKRIEGVSDLRDESDRDGMRIVIELKRDAQAGVVMNQLYKLTPMQSTFGVIQLAIVQGQPRVLSLKEMLSIFVDHRRDVVTRRTRYELREAEKRLHILEGLKRALDNLDAVIDLIKKSAAPQIARERLGERFSLSEIQAQAILDMKLQRLTGLEREKIVEEYRQVVAEIARLKAILESDELLTSVVKGEIVEIRDKYGDKRRTEIVDAVAEIALEDMIVEEDMVVTISHSGYIKRNALSLYRSQRRGGRGVTGMGTKEEDFVVDLFVASTKSYVLIFTTSGRLFWLKVHEIPEGGRAARGKAIVNLLKLEPGEKQAAIVPVRAFEEGKNVVMATRRGIVKKTDLMAYSNPRPSGIIGVLIEEGDALIDARLTDGTKDIFIGTAEGMSIRFEEAEVRPTGRAAYGVKGIALGEGDQVVAMDIVNPGASILTVTENGFGKRTPVEEYRQQGRAGSGVITIKTSERNGRVVGVAQVTDDDQVMLITSGGQVIRTRVAEIRESGRNTQGVKLINVSEGEKVVAVARLAERDSDADEPPPEKPVAEA